MWVVKLGGSLQHAAELPQWLDLLARQERGRTVVVPGGGAFADKVRHAQQRWRFDDAAAHRMAILAMQQTALMLNGMQNDLQVAASLEEIGAMLERGESVVWSPQYQALDAAGIAASWDITSDSLAAWLANELRASGLLLVKSAQIPESLGIAELAKQGIVDKAFPAFAATLACPVKVVQCNALAIISGKIRAATGNA